MILDLAIAEQEQEQVILCFFLNIIHSFSMKIHSFLQTERSECREYGSAVEHPLFPIVAGSEC